MSFLLEEAKLIQIKNKKIQNDKSLSLFNQRYSNISIYISEHAIQRQLRNYKYFISQMQILNILNCILPLLIKKVVIRILKENEKFFLYNEVELLVKTRNNINIIFSISEDLYTVSNIKIDDFIRRTFVIKVITVMQKESFKAREGTIIIDLKRHKEIKCNESDMLDSDIIIQKTQNVSNRKKKRIKRLSLVT